MSENWDYSKMTHTAALSGGPEAYADALKREGMRLGIALQKKASMTDSIIIGGACFAGGWLIYYGITKYQKHRCRVQIELEKAEKNTEVAKENFIESVQASTENPIDPVVDDHANSPKNEKDC